jgi:hypothetical protein
MPASDHDCYHDGWWCAVWKQANSLLYQPTRIRGFLLASIRDGANSGDKAHH